MAEALRDELLSVPGIAGAEVDTDQGVAGVRVQLAVGADAEEVGAAVRRILTDHGMRPADESAGESAGEPAEEAVTGPPPPPGAPGSVVSFPLVGEHARTQPTAGEAVGEVRLESVAIEETPEGVVVLVRSADGSRASSTLESGLAEMDGAVVAVVAELIGAGPVTLVDVLEETVDELVVLTVLVGSGEGPPQAGAAVQLGGRAYAIARATWAALTLPA
jgi:hypothetical protein